MTKIKLLLCFFTLFFLAHFKSYAQQIRCTTSYLDIEKDSEMCYFVNFMDYQRISVGYSDLTFRPDANVDRRMFATFIQRAFKIEENTTNFDNVDKFNDIAEDDWLFPIAHKLRKANIISGFSGNLFKPDEIITREQASRFLYSALLYKDISLLGEKGYSSYTDVDIETNKFHKFIDALYSSTRDFQSFDQIFQYNEGLFEPTKNLNRGEISKILVNSLNYGRIVPKTAFPNFLDYRTGIKSSNIYSDNSFKIHNFDSLNMTILVTKKPFEFNYIPNGPVEFLNLVNNSGYRYALNGSFFGGTTTKAEHAGFLNFWGIELTPLKTAIEEGDKPQLTHIVRYDTSNEKIEFIQREKFTPSLIKKTVLEFQTGPIVIDTNQIQVEHIFKSKNGRTQHYRTLLGYNHDTQEKYFVVVKTPMSLQQIGNILLNLDIIQNTQTSFINLDGGSSTRFYSQRYPELNWKEDKPIPVVIGLK